MMENFRREFLGNVSHELKTPIFNIQGYIHTLIDGALYDEKVNMAYLERTSKSVDRMINIVEDLVTISKIESDRLDLEMENFDIVDLAKDIFDQTSTCKNSVGNIVITPQVGSKCRLIIIATQCIQIERLVV